ncbi:hypothetical protein LO80_00170 [Candidatus Francisella endociliophora]|uniref:Uncharacterized protein n=1 Tax=Candidatus Francisella endociliophora TaxID=653937 RepID=A0A097ELU7_9GAMM|nr:hypothetical protein [Francisella sp. FSC1006]AIT08541.1 hypothetical protein LO80_00170 [Francisella sp. FSC1006]
MFNNFFACIILLFLTNFLIAAPITYYCPSPQDFIQKNQKLTAKTKYHEFKYSWIATDQTHSQFPEYPLTFKGANLVDCKSNLCDLKCYYYSNIEGHIITSTIQSNNRLHIYKYPNHYLKNFSCQYTEHVDCPFIINVY